MTNVVSSLVPTPRPLGGEGPHGTCVDFPGDSRTWAGRVVVGGNCVRVTRDGVEVQVVGVVKRD